MATGDLSLKITVGGTAYYVSDDEYLADDANFHYGYVLQAPSITLGVSRGGYANFSSGRVILENRPLDTHTHLDPLDTPVWFQVHQQPTHLS